MILWSDINRSMSAASVAYVELQKRFNKFASLIESQAKQQNFRIQGLSIETSLDENYFTVKFAGMAVCFQFSTLFSDKRILNGAVCCYLLPCFPEKDYIKLREFTFTTMGKTSIPEPEMDGEFLYINDENAALYLILNVLNDALVRKVS